MKKEEYWDVYDINRNKTGKKIKRGDRLQSDEYHLFVQVWLKNKDGKFLSQKRSKYVKWPHMWCANGGNAISGEDGYACARREILEELSIDIKDLEGGFIDSRLYFEDNQNYFCDSFLYYIDKEIKDIKFQEEEIEELKFMDMDEIITLMKKGDYFIYDEDYLEMIRKK